MNLPVHRSIIGIDVEKSTGPLRTNPVKQEIRQELYRMTEQALAVTGIGDGDRWPFEDRGDGLLGLIHPNVPKALLLTRFIPELVRQLNLYDLGLSPEERARRSIRLRVVVHAGEVHQDEKGCFGESLDVACRMLDSPRLKRSLSRSASALALVVSEQIYWDVVHHGYEGLQPGGFIQDFHVLVTGRRHRAWTHLPGENGARRGRLKPALALFSPVDLSQQQDRSA
ncbi:hypothetical protein [Actinocorallia longicatena]|uniref:hypothetical protein n=1 Tax=Actinocorallia longicatena TaxID=111803 RepID=UPI0031DAA022